MTKPIKNYGKLVKTKLLNLMNSSGYKYMYLLARYFNERLLYHVSVSPYRDVPSINIQAYSLETIVAEKFHAMVERDVNNSRMKDFFDCNQILTTKELDDELLYEAIKATFDNRKLAYNANLQLFNDDFFTDEVRLKRWEVFLKKIQWKESLSFANVMAVIIVRLKGLYDRYWEKK